MRSCLLLLLVSLASSSFGQHLRTARKTPLTAVNPVDVVLDSVQPSVHHLDRDLFKSFKKIHKALRKPEVLKKFSNAGNDSNLECMSALGRLANDLKSGSYYALQAFDAWGKPESGYLQGNTRWLGRYKECLGAENNSMTVNVTISNGTFLNGTVFTPKYCVANLGIAQVPQPLAQWALCIPDQCNTTVLDEIIRQYLPKTLSSTTACDPLDFPYWSTSDKFALFLCCFLLFLVLMSSVFELALMWTAKQKSKNYEKMESESSAKPPPKSKLVQLGLSFSLIQNTRLFLDTKQRDGQIHCLHGIRFFSMCWVVLGHSQLFAMQALDNASYLFSWTTAHFTHQIVVNGTFSVDTFFFLSGLLVAYLGMRAIEQRRGKVNAPLMYFMRYWRLTPAYAFVILFSVTLWMKLGEGPVFYQSALAQKAPCSKYWWTNLLYINNMYPSNMGDECYGVGWYLANDTQFYLLAPLFLYLLYKLPILGIGLLTALIGISTLLGGVFSNLTNQQPMVIFLSQAFKSALFSGSNAELAAGDNYTAATTVGDEHQYSVWISDLYAKPYVRIHSYLVGFLTGYILHKYRETGIKIPEKYKVAVVSLGWMVSTAVCGGILFGLYPTYKHYGSLDVNVAAFYNAVSRPLWCCAMAWIVVACVHGYGGPVNTFLSLKLWMPLSRLTYNSYLVHPLVLYFTYMNVERLYHIDMYSLAVLYIGQLVLTHMFAYLLAMTVEFPFSTLIKLLGTLLVGKPSSSSQRQQKKAPTTQTNGLQNGGAAENGTASTGTHQKIDTDGDHGTSEA